MIKTYSTKTQNRITEDMFGQVTNTSSVQSTESEVADLRLHLFEDRLNLLHFHILNSASESLLVSEVHWVLPKEHGWLETHETKIRPFFDKYF